MRTKGGTTVRFETLAVHAGDDVDDASGAVVPPIHLSTTYRRAADGRFPSGNNYIRDDNPNRRALEACLAALEGGGAAAAFASGMAATMTIFQALTPGDHVVVPFDAYFGTRKLVDELFVPWGLHATLVDPTNLGQVRAALRPETKLVWLESPSNPLIGVSDLAAVAALAHEAGARVVCDNTWATPMLQQPLALGVDLVMHSTTKYLSGHGDVMGGAVVARREDAFFRRIRTLQADGGAVPAPLDCWLVRRGIRSLPSRMQRHCANAALVAAFLAEHPGVERVYYPGLTSDPGHALAAKQMRWFGGMLSFVMPSGRDQAFAVAGRLRLFTRATSMGGPSSLVEHRASIEGPGTVAPDGLLRLSIGLEHADDLIEDLQQALA
jgi:cystathionine gamma-synthase